MKSKLIFNSYIAKLLIQKGNLIIDLKKNKNLENATVFVFEDTDKFKQDLIEATKEAARFKK